MLLGMKCCLLLYRPFLCDYLTLSRLQIIRLTQKKEHHPVQLSKPASLPKNRAHEFSKMKKFNKAAKVSNPCRYFFGAENGIRTRDPRLGKPMLYP